MGLRDMLVDVVKGRKSRVTKLGIALNAIIMVRERSTRDRGVSSRVVEGG